MSPAVVADTGGLLRALARRSNGEPSWPEYEQALVAARAVIVPSLVLAEVDYFLRTERRTMRRLIAEIFDPKTTYEYELPTPTDVVRAMQLDHKFKELRLSLTDAFVATVAERRAEFRVLTTDRRDFGALRVGPTYRKALTLLP